MGHFYFICRFVQTNGLSRKPYVYETDERNFCIAKVGKRYRLMNENGYNYNGNTIEITGLYNLANNKIIVGPSGSPYMVKEEDIKPNSAVEIKKVKELTEVGEAEHYKETIRMYKQNLTLNFDTPIVYRNTYGREIPCESIEDVFSNMSVEEVLKAREKVPFMIAQPDKITRGERAKLNLYDESTMMRKDILDMTAKEADFLFEEATVKTVKLVLDEETVNARDLKIFSLKEKEKNTMDKIFGNFEFGRYTGNQIKMSVNGMAYRNKDGKYVAYDKEKNTLTDVSDFTLDMGQFLYNMPVAINDIEPGDIVRHMNEYMIVTGKQFDNISVIAPTSGEVKTIIPVRNVFGFNFYTKVVSLIGNGVFNGISEDSPFGNMLPLMMLSGDESGDKFDFKTLMMMQMLNGGGSAMNFQNPMMMMMMLMGDSDGSAGMDKYLPMMMFMNGGMNFNPFGATNECSCGKDCKCEGAEAFGPMYPPTDTARHAKS